MRPTGKVNLIGLAMLLAIAAGVYWLVVIAPVYLQKSEVKEALQMGFNKYGLDHTESIVKGLMIKFNDPNEFGHSVIYDQDGQLTTVDGLGVKTEDIDFLPDDRNKELTVRLRYVRVIKLRPLEKYKAFRFTVEIHNAFPH